MLSIKEWYEANARVMVMMYEATGEAWYLDQSIESTLLAEQEVLLAA